MQMLVRRTAWLVAFVSVLCLIATWLVLPRHFVVDGRSMLPGLAAGDVIEASGRLFSWRPPRRHERWLVQMPEGTRLLKRVAGLPGETLSIDSGDVLIDGQRLLPSPRLLAATAARVEGGVWQTHTLDEVLWQMYEHRVVDLSQPAEAQQRVVPGPIYDSLPDDPDEHRRLEPASSVGLAAVLSSTAPADIRLLVCVGPQAASLQLAAGERIAVVAGRLAGRFVVAGWRIPGTTPFEKCFPSSPLPAPREIDWSLIREAVPLDFTRQAPRLALGIEHEPTATAAAVSVEHLSIWRGPHLTPPADGQRRWQIPAGRVFLLGDHPAASRDSRHFGPVPTSRLLAPLRGQGQ